MAKRREFAPVIEQAIQAAAQRHGLNPQALRAFARIESGGNPSVQTGSYKGLFQLSNAEFRRYGGRGDIFDPVANADAAAAKLAAETSRLERRLGREPTAGDMYLVHQQGEGGALKHRTNPDRAAWQNMYSTAEGQKKGSEWAKQAIWGNIPNADKKRFGSVENVTSRDFMKMWNDKVASFGGAKSITELAMKGGGAVTSATQMADASPTVPIREKTAAVSPEGLVQPEMKSEVIASAPDMAGPLGPIQTSSQQIAQGSSDQMPTPSDAPGPGVDYGAMSSTLAGGGEIGGGLGGSLKGTIASIFGIGSPSGGGGIFGLGGKGGGGGFKNQVAIPDMGNTFASYAQSEASMGPSGDDVLSATLPPPPPRTPEGLPVGNFSELVKRRRRSQVG